MRNKQQKFQETGFEIPKDSFGGALLKNSHAKTKRPLDSKLPIHLVLRAKQSVLRLPKNFAKVNQKVEGICKKHGVTVYKYSNVGNHIHILIKIPGRPRWSAYIRELTGRIAQLVSTENGFWLQLPFTRVVKGWRKAFETAKDYIHLNLLEAEGFISRKDTKTLKDLRAIWDPPYA